MRIVGEWLRGDDGIVRPTVRINIRGADDQTYSRLFLVDSGSDRMVFSAELVEALELPLNHPPALAALMGVGGAASFLIVATVMELERDDGGAATIRGEFSAFTDPLALDLSILGRDVLDNFDLVLSRRRNEVVLLAPPHTYHVSRA